MELQGPRASESGTTWAFMSGLTLDVHTPKDIMVRALGASRTTSIRAFGALRSSCSAALDANRCCPVDPPR